MNDLFRPLAAALLLSVSFAGTGGSFGQESPMVVQPVPADDEPESAVPAPAGTAPAEPDVKAASPAANSAGPVVSAFPPHQAPLPPTRPFMLASPVTPATPFTLNRADGGVAPPPQPSAGTLIASAPLPPVRPAAPQTPAPQTLVPAQPAPVATTPASPAPEPEVAQPAAPDRPEMRVASLPSAVPPATTQPSTTEEIEAEEEKAPEPMLVEKQTDAVDIACLQPELLRLVRIAGEHFKGTPVITSGQRNRGRRGSYHRKCMAADFFIPGIERARLAKYLRTLPGAGGVGTYCHTKSVHIDTGDARNWWQCGFRFRFAQR